MCREILSQWRVNFTSKLRIITGTLWVGVGALCPALPLLREDCGGALGDLSHPGQEVEPGEGDLPERGLGEAPRVEEQRELAAVDHVVEGAPGRVAAVDVQHVSEAVAAPA